MRFLIITERWGSFAGIAAVRPMKFAKYLLLKGHHVMVLYGTDNSQTICEDPELNWLHQQQNYSEKRVFESAGIFKIIDNKITSRASYDNRAEKKPLHYRHSKKRNNLKREIISFIYRTIYLKLRSSYLVHKAL